METFHLYHFGLVCLGRDLKGSAKEIVAKRNKGELKPTVFCAGAHIIVGELLGACNLLWNGSLISNTRRSFQRTV
jgi:hypothetical protein